MTSSATTRDTALMARGLDLLAGLNGGWVFRVVAAAEGAFERIGRELSGFYELGIDSVDADRDGKPHEIKVVVARDGVEVRARTRFVVAAAQAAPQSAEAHARHSLEALLPEADVPVAVTGLVLGDEDGGVQLVVAAEIGLGADLAGQAAVGFRLLDAAGKVAAGAGVR